MDKDKEMEFLRALYMIQKASDLGDISLDREPDKEEGVMDMDIRYMCVNGHTFDRPIVGDRLGLSYGIPVYACPTCYTQDFEMVRMSQGLDDEECETKTRVTNVGKKIRGFMMIPFKCPLCCCEFESPISECSMFIVTCIDDVLAVRHKCPNESCGVECEIILDKDLMFVE